MEKLRIVVYLKKDKKNEEYLKIKNEFYNQSLDGGLNKAENDKYILFLKSEYEIIKSFTTKEITKI